VRDEFRHRVVKFFQSRNQLHPNERSGFEIREKITFNSFAPTNNIGHCICKQNKY